MIVCDGYLPVPTIRRDRKVLPAITNGSDIELTTADEVDDFDFVILMDDRRGVCVAFDNDEVVFHRNATRVDTERLEEAAHRHRAGNLVRLTVEANRQIVLQRF